jgi:hypothetical protein
MALNYYCLYIDDHFEGLANMATRMRPSLVLVATNRTLAEGTRGLINKPSVKACRMEMMSTFVQLSDRYGGIQHIVRSKANGAMMSIVVIVALQCSQTGQVIIGHGNCARIGFQFFDG